MEEYKEAHAQGEVFLENLNSLIIGVQETLWIQDADLGISIAKDGRVWICVNGISFLRFTPSRKIEKYALGEQDLIK